MAVESLNVGFISTRLAGTDGVSLEVDKWVEVLHRMGHQCSCFCGTSDWPGDRSYVVEEAHFEHPEILAINRDLFEEKRRTEETTKNTDRLKLYLKNEIRNYVEQFEIDLIIGENTWSLPMNVPLGLALSEFIGDCELPAIAHHHDFWWDRQRFLGAPADDYLSAGFPSTLDRIQHVVINSVDLRQLSYRHGVSPVLIPNVMDFKNPPPAPDRYGEDMRDQLGIKEHEKFILQPTRIVPRKKIEMSIELLKYLEHPGHLVITHEAGDEGMSYHDYVKNYASLLGVNVCFASDRFQQTRDTGPQGRKLYSLRDAYQQCDLVTYPSSIEGFGNAFLETIYYQQPIVIQNYEIFKLDILPKGFDVITVDDFITPQVVEQADSLLENPEEVRNWTDHNYTLGKRYYSYERLEKKLEMLLEQALDKSIIY